MRALTSARRRFGACATRRSPAVCSLDRLAATTDDAARMAPASVSARERAGALCIATRPLLPRRFLTRRRYVGARSQQQRSKTRAAAFRASKEMQSSRPPSLLFRLQQRRRRRQRRAFPRSPRSSGRHGRRRRYPRRRRAHFRVHKIGARFATGEVFGNKHAVDDRRRNSSFARPPSTVSMAVARSRRPLRILF